MILSNNVTNHIRKPAAIDPVFLTLIPHAVVVMEGRKIIFANEAVEAVFGWKPGELVDRDARVLCRSDEEYEELIGDFYSILLRQKTHVKESYCRHKNGTDVLCKVNASKVCSELREKGIVVMCEDITERKEIEEALRESEKKFQRAAEEWRATFDSMPYGVMLLDQNLNILRTNSYVSELTGVPLKETANKKCYELIHGTDKETKNCMVRKAVNIKSTGVLQYRDTRSRKYFMEYITPIFDDREIIKNYVISLVDISEIREKEKKLIETRNAFYNMLTDIDISYKKLKEICDGIIYSFINALDAKSPWTKGHSERVTNYSMLIATEMGLEDRDMETLRIAALLHDIGKIGTYDVILEKPEKLSAEEFALVKMHPVKGKEILKPLVQLEHVFRIIRAHHERVDGSGYPDGLKDKEIPMLARIITVADSFDSMTSNRPYRPAPGTEYAVAELKMHSGTQFDAEIVETFLRVLDRQRI